MRNLIGTRRILAAVIAVGALLVTAAVAVALLAAHHGHTGASAVRPSPTPSTSPVPVPSGAVSLVQGARLADGIEVGYPHTTVGAISAAAQYLDAVASTLDPDYAASLGRTVGDPAVPALPGNLAASATKLRAALQLPAEGPVPAPAAFMTTAQMYQLRATGADNATVLLLTSNTFINTHGGTAGTVGVYPVRMHWTGGDWHLAGIGTGVDYSALAATPDTQAAASQGWQALIPATGSAL